MKKILAILLCLIMVVAAAVPAFAVDTAQTNTTTANAGPLAITEVCIRSPEEGYSYIEILNTSDKEIDLSGYYLYRTAFSNGSGMWYASGTYQMLGLNGQKASQLAAVKLTGIVKPGEVLVVWLKHANKTKSFVDYWNERGASLTSDDVVTVDVSSLPLSAVQGSAGPAFLQRNTYTMTSLALVKADKATNVATGNTYTATQVNVRNLFKDADCVVLLNFMRISSTAAANMPSGVVTFNSFIEEESWNSAVDAAQYHSAVKTKNKYYYDDLYAGFAIPNKYLACDALMNLSTGWNYNNGGTEAITVPAVDIHTNYTPGKLDGVQYGYTDAGPIAITEIVPNPTNASYEYVEVMNTTSASVNLKDYYLYRQMEGTVGGTKEGTTLGTMVGYSVMDNTVKYSLSSFDIALAKNTPVVIWLDSAGTDADLSGFKTYWQNLGADFTGVTVLRLNVSDNLAKNAVADTGNGFLPDKGCAYNVSLIGSAFAATDDVSVNEGANVKARNNASVASIVLWARVSTNTTDKAANRFGYFDRASYAAAVKAAGAWVSTAVYYNWSNGAEMFSSLMMPRTDDDGKALLSTIANTEAAYDMTTPGNGLYYLDISIVEHPTPGKLVEGQFGYSDTEEQKGLTITEIVSSTQGTTANDNMYEFIEVTNTSDNDISLDNYQVMMNAVRCSGGYHGSMVLLTADMTSTREFQVNSRGVAFVGGNTVLKSGETAVIWFNNTNSGLAENDFKQFWSGRGNDMTNVKVAQATYKVGTRVSDLGYGFMPDTRFAYTLYLVNEEGVTSGSAIANALNAFYGTEASIDVDTQIAQGDNAKAIRQALHSYADSIAYVYQMKNEVANVSTNFYGYVDTDKYYQQAIELYNENYKNNVASALNVVPVSDNFVAKNGTPLDIYYSYGKGYGVSGYGTINKAGTDNRIFLDNYADSVPTPGVLLNGQLGYNSAKSDIEVLGWQTTAAKTVSGVETTDVRIIGWISDEAYAGYDLIGIEVAAASEATNTATVVSGVTYSDKEGHLANAVCTREQNFTVSNVYESIKGGGETYTVESFGKTSGYLFAINLTDIPTSNFNLTFTCYLANANGETVTAVVYTGMYQITDTSAS